MDCGPWERTVIIALFLREYGQILVFEVDVFQVEPLATLIIAVPKYLGSAHARIGEEIEWGIRPSMAVAGSSGYYSASTL